MRNVHSYVRTVSEMQKKKKTIFPTWRLHHWEDGSKQRVLFRPSVSHSYARLLDPFGKITHFKRHHHHQIVHELSCFSLNFPFLSEKMLTTSISVVALVAVADMWDVHLIFHRCTYKLSAPDTCLPTPNLTKCVLSPFRKSDECKPLAKSRTLTPISLTSVQSTHGQR